MFSYKKGVLRNRSTCNKTVAIQGDVQAMSIPEEAILVPTGNMDHHLEVFIKHFLVQLVKSILVTVAC